jgi:hypothetical protein
MLPAARPARRDAASDQLSILREVVDVGELSRRATLHKLANLDLFESTRVSGPKAVSCDKAGHLVAADSRSFRLGVDACETTHWKSTL